MKLIRLMPPIASMQDAVILSRLALWWLAQPHNPPAITYSESRERLARSNDAVD